MLAKIKVDNRTESQPIEQDELFSQDLYDIESPLEIDKDSMDGDDGTGKYQIRIDKD